MFIVINTDIYIYICFSCLTLLKNLNSSLKTFLIHPWNRSLSLYLMIYLGHTRICILAALGDEFFIIILRYSYKRDSSRRWLSAKKVITSSHLESKTRHIHHRSLSGQIWTNVLISIMGIDIYSDELHTTPPASKLLLQQLTRSWLTSMFTFNLTYYYYILSCVYRLSIYNTQRPALVHKLCKYMAGP